MKILLVEDHASLGALIQKMLGESGYLIDWVTSGEAALYQLQRQHYDALILDLGLPDMDGMQVLKRAVAHQQADIPCLVLTARCGLDSRVGALDAGADDYIVKPFDMPELEARLRAVLRRPGQRKSAHYHLGELVFDQSSHTLTVHQQSCTLARREALLLELLFQATPRVVVKDQLEERLYGMDEYVSRNAVEALVSRTRRKLRQLQADCQIETLHGVGYRLVKTPLEMAS